MIKIAASIMCASQLHLANELDRLAAAKVDMLHCDVMDGTYVDNLAMGPYVLEEINRYTTIPLDIHLAVFEPEKYIKLFLPSNPEFISVHAESTNHLHRTIGMIKEGGVKAAVALNPSTPLSALKHVIQEVDMVLIMTVDPGFAGQNFVMSTLEKIRSLKEMCREQGLTPLIQVDGNINSRTIPLAVAEGANVLVGGTSSIFRGADADYNLLVQEMRDCAAKVMKE